MIRLSTYLQRKLHKNINHKTPNMKIIVALKLTIINQIAGDPNWDRTQKHADVRTIDGADDPHTTQDGRRLLVGTAEASN